MKKYIVPLIEKRQEAKDTMTFRFSLELDFKAGQYIMLELDVEDPKGNDRPFTISSAPTDKGYIEITTKISDSPFKQKLASLEPGTNIDIMGPLGTFIFQSDISKQSVMIAGGIGITPFRSIIRNLTAIDSNASIMLLYSNKTPEEIALKQELSELQKKNKHLRVIHTITRPEESKEKWSGLTGRIDESFIRKYSGYLENNMFYVCGPPTMVDGMLEILKSMQIPENQIKLERFIGY